MKDDGQIQHDCHDGERIIHCNLLTQGNVQNLFCTDTTRFQPLSVIFQDKQQVSTEMKKTSSSKSVPKNIWKRQVA